jgi:hypothetical protein
MPNNCTGTRYARMRGLARVQQQLLLAAIAQKIKKIALLLSKTGPQGRFHCSRLFSPISSLNCSFTCNSLALFADQN